MKTRLSLTALLAGLLIITGCQKDDAPLPENMANFSTTELGLDKTESSKTFSVGIGQKMGSDVTLELGITESDIAYNTDYTTTPAAENGSIKVTIPAGETSASITVSKKEGRLFNGDEKLTISIRTTPAGIVVGASKELSIVFGAIVSTVGELTLNGGEGGSTAANSVFVDLSSNEQASPARKSWNLGLSSAAGFGVILNNTTSSTALAADVAIDAIVSSADSATYASSLALSYTAEAFNLIDDWAGDMSKSVIKEGKVYIVNLGESQAPLYKVKVTLKDANTYTVQYAKINDANVTSVDVKKNSAYDFVYLSFAAGKEVAVAPQKAKWDIVWGRSLYYTTMSSTAVPYTYSDLVFINAANGAKAAEVLTTQKSYADFTKADVAGVTFSSSVDAIGSKWRNGGGPTSQPAVKTDRFYLIQDAQGNIYKLQFVNMGGGDGGTRGYPKIKYELLS